MAHPNNEWQRKGATLSHKTARREFGLTQDEIYDAIDAGALQYRQAYMHGNPWWLGRFHLGRFHLDLEPS